MIDHPIGNLKKIYPKKSAIFLPCLDTKTKKIVGLVEKYWNTCVYVDLITIERRLYVPSDIIVVDKFLRKIQQENAYFFPEDLPLGVWFMEGHQGNRIHLTIRLSKELDYTTLLFTPDEESCIFVRSPCDNYGRVPKQYVSEPIKLRNK